MTAMEAAIERNNLSADHTMLLLKDQISKLQACLTEEEEKLAVLLQQLVECNDERTELLGFYVFFSLPTHSLSLPFPCIC